MELVHAIFGAITDALIAMTSMFDPGLGLVVASGVVGIVMLAIFRYASDHDDIEAAKHRMQAHLMEMRLFDREPGVVIKAMGNLFAWNGRYFLRSLKPAAVLMPPTIFLLVHFDHAYGARPVNVGEEAIVTAKIGGDESFEATAGQAKLSGDATVEVETMGVRSIADREIAWRVRGIEAGTGTLTLEVGDETIEKSFDVEGPLRRISYRRGNSRSDRLFFPVEAPLESDKVEWIDIRYPAFEPPVFGFAIHWLVTLFIVSVFGALGIRVIVNKIRPGLL